MGTFDNEWSKNRREEIKGFKESERAKGEFLCKKTQAFLYKTFETNGIKMQDYKNKYYSSGRKVGIFDEISFFLEEEEIDSNTIQMRLVVFSKDEINSYAKSHRIQNGSPCLQKIFEFKPEKI